MEAQRGSGLNFKDSSDSNAQNHLLGFMGME